MRILFVKPKHIGDSLILTPTIAATKKAYPDSEIWVLVRRGCEGILAGCPQIDHIRTLAPVETRDRNGRDPWRDLRTLLGLWKVKFDYVFELGDGHRARLFAMLSRSKRLYSVKTASPLTPLERLRFTAASSFDWWGCHRVEKDFFSVAEFLELPLPIPSLQFDRRLIQVWEPGRDLTDFAIMQIGARQRINRWTSEGWHEVGRNLLERHEAVVVTCGSDSHEVEEAESLRRDLGPRVLCTVGQATWAQMADLLYRARLYVGTNTAAMHLAAACGCPVVALFGPSREEYWYPWQIPYRVATSHGFIPSGDPLERSPEVQRRSMREIRADDVIAACAALTAEQTFRSAT